MLPNPLASGCSGRCCWLDPAQGSSTTQMAGVAALANERISKPWSRCWTSESCGVCPLAALGDSLRAGAHRADETGRTCRPAVSCPYHQVTTIGVVSRAVPSGDGSYRCPARSRCLKSCAAPLQVPVEVLRCHAVQCWQLYGEPTGTSKEI